MKKTVLLFALALLTTTTFAQQYLYSELIPWQNTVACPGVPHGSCPTFDQLCVDMTAACPPTEQWSRMGTPHQAAGIGVGLWATQGGNTEGIFTNFNFIPGKKYIIRVGVNYFDKIGSSNTKLRMFAATDLSQSGSVPCCHEPVLEGNFMPPPNNVNAHWVYNTGTPVVPQIEFIADVKPASPIYGTTQMYNYGFTPTMGNSQFVLYAENEVEGNQLNSVIDYVLIEEDCENTGFMYWGFSDDPYRINFDGNYTEKNTSWDLGDGTVSTMQYVNHVYGAPGTYTVCLKNENPFGHYCEYCRDICVGDAYISDPDGFQNGGDPPCDPPHFNYQVFPEGGGVAVSPGGNYSDLVDIDFGDGNVLTGVNQLTSYINNYAYGNYTICVSKTNDPNCKVCMDICINPPRKDSWGYAVGGGSDPDAKTTSFGSVFTNTDRFEQLQVVPNPANDKITLNFAVGTTDKNIVDIEVYDVAGRKVISQQNNVSVGLNGVTVDISGLNSGIYIINVKNGMNTIKSRVVKQ